MSSKRSQPEDRSPDQNRVRPPPALTADEAGSSPTGLESSPAALLRSAQPLESPVQALHSAQPSMVLGDVPSPSVSAATADSIKHTLLTSSNTLNPTPITVHTDILAVLAMTVTSAVKDSPGSADELEINTRVLRGIFNYMQHPSGRANFDPTPLLATFDDASLAILLRNNPAFSEKLSAVVNVVENAIYEQVNPSIAAMLQYGAWRR
ncbi:hypothetical protein AURDEDRAFT_169836 [Auricularia subglabra TFB-10046 SS5]|nr:hypothetical protein AURDEDRAFT_169836 [Auricularia subglabra TFB-10046 SS5]